LAITKLDVLDGLAEIKICKGYRLGKEEICTVPALVEDYNRVEPIYETLPGWQESTVEVQKLEDLPRNARRYIERIQHLCEAPASLLSVGPDREKTLHLKNIF
jgi:adenylosuccinate synthase